MKKILIATCMMLGFASIVSAQKPTTTSKPSAIKPATTATKPAATAKVSTAKPVKADGTPDMRFKANQTAAKPAVKGPLKADGTPDKRFKANQTKAPAQKAKTK